MYHFVTRLLFIVGLVLGAFLAILLDSNCPPAKEIAPQPSKPFSLETYEKWFRTTNLTRTPLQFDAVRYGNQSYLLESAYLKDRIDVLCIVLVRTPKNAEAAKATWARSCTSIKLLNLTVDKKMMPVRRKKEDSSWAVLCRALKEAPATYEWVLVVYDYTFVLMENLRLFVAGLDPDRAHYLGHAVQLWSTVYNAGQAGYVLSRGSVRALGQKLKSADACATGLTYRNQEDYYLGRHLAALNVTPADTRDSTGLSVFHPYNLNHVFFPGDSYYRFSFYRHKCCSPYTVAFQSIEGDKMYTYYYLLYQLQIFHKGNLGNRPPSKPVPDEEVWKHFLRTRGVSTNISSEQYYKVWEDVVDDPTSFASRMRREEYVDYNN